MAGSENVGVGANALRRPGPAFADTAAAMGVLGCERFFVLSRELVS